MKPEALHLDEKGDGVLIRLRVRARAARNALSLGEDGQLRAYTTAPPVDDKANEAICRQVAQALGLGKTRVIVAAGAHARDKTLFVDNMSKEEAARKLIDVLDGP